MNPLVSTERSSKQSNGFKSARNMTSGVPEADLSDLQSFNSKLKTEVSDTISGIEKKLLQFQSRKDERLKDRSKTILQKLEEVDDYDGHMKQVAKRKLKLDSIRKDINRMRKEISTSYNESEIISLEDKLKFVKSQKGDIEEELAGLRNVKKSMKQAINKFDEDKDIKTRRVQYIKHQTEAIKEQYKEEFTQYRLEERTFDKSHKEFMNMGEYYRNAVTYVKEKRDQSNKNDHTKLPVLNSDQDRNENANVNMQIENCDNDKESIFEEKRLNKVNSFGSLPKRTFFKKRVERTNNGFFSPTREDPYQLTHRTSPQRSRNDRAFSTLPTMEDFERIDKQNSKKQKLLVKKENRLNSLKLKTTNLKSHVKKQNLFLEQRDNEIRTLNIKMAEMRRFIHDAKNKQKLEKQKEERMAQEEDEQRLLQMRRDNHERIIRQKQEVEHFQRQRKKQEQRQFENQSEAQDSIKFIEYNGEAHDSRDGSKSFDEGKNEEEHQDTFITQSPLKQVTQEIAEVTEADETTMHGTLKNKNSEFKNSFKTNESKDKMLKQNLPSNIIILSLLKSSSSDKIV